MMSEKPVIFISHSSQDSELALLLKQQIELCFDNDVEAFAADIDPGENWFEKVMVKLNKADAIVVLITHYSVNISHWVWFELGYFWARHNDSLNSPDAKRKIYYPLYMSEIEWPNPVKDLQIQATPLNDRNGLLRFFKQLCHQFEGGNIDSIQIDEIVELASNYPTRFLPNSILALNSSTTTNYSDGTIKEHLDDYLFQEYNFFRSQFFPVRQLILSPANPLSSREASIFTGKIIHYDELDTELNLPSGSSKRLLKPTAKDYGLVPITGREHEDSIRFKYVQELDLYKEKPTT